MFSKTILSFLLISFLTLVYADQEKEPDPCETETETLSETLATEYGELVNASEAAGFIDVFDADDLIGFVPSETDPLPSQCVLQGGNNETLICQFDYETIEPEFSAYNSSCTSAGGVFYTDDFKMICSSGDSRTELQYLHRPQCVGASCDIEKVEEAFEGEIEDLEDELSEDPGVNCLHFLKFDKTWPPSGATVKASSTAILVLSTVVALVSLLS